MKKILVTGAFGQIGSELVPALQKKYGLDSVVSMGHANVVPATGTVVQGEIRDKATLEDIITKHDIGTVYHMVSLLSATGEKNPELAWDINMNGLKNVLDLGLKYNLRVFWPSSIAAFGPTTPREHTPQRTVLEPTTMYGVTKVAGENLCHYYHVKHGLDVRGVRYPGLLSHKTHPGGGTTDFAVAIFYGAIQEGKYECFVKEETMLPMMYMDDAVRATIELMEADPSKLTVWNSYNLAAMSFTARELATEIQKHIKVDVTYKPDFRQKIADSWPRSIDDSQARNDWGWKHEYDLKKTVKVMLQELQAKL